MYKRVLAAVNEHLNSEITARYAMEFARSCGAKLFICFIADKSLPHAALRNAENAVSRLFIQAEEIHVPVESISDSGDPAARIEQIVRRAEIDLAFVSTRRTDMKRRFYAGSVSRRLLLHLPCSVALVRVVHAGMIRPRRILVPLKARIDQVQQRAFFTAQFANAFDARLFLLYASPPAASLFGGHIHLTPIEWQQRLPESIAAFIKTLQQQGAEVEHKVSPGAAGKTIRLEAVAKPHDLILMGASQRSLISSLFQGNPVEEVLRATPCDLILFRPRHEN
ncbi:MAG: hypothetical protein A3F68_01655 [Acidobacteria bacterium RIFCSPLOWO2_12_FULL_54_10]|nr:MAG: hypothetical protein A3F68_01655 [Acidobacteria bacterium RIFCSPLOWO2_12_FULL_54_10]